MKITKLEHSGLIIEKDEKRIVFDPSEFTSRLPKIDNVVAIVITHKHGDHLQPNVLARIINDNPDAKIFTTRDAAPLIEKAIIAKAGDTQELGGFRLDFFGKDHAAVIQGQIPCENIGVAVDGRIVNPGDSFELPNIQTDVLFVAISAPWLKIAESMEYVESAKPKIVIPVHNALLSEFGESINGSCMKGACDNVGAEYKELKPGESMII